MRAIPEIMSGGARRLLALAAGLALLALPGAIASPARAVEVIPAIGLTRAVGGEGQARLYGSLALRGDVLPLLQTEVAVAYREESRFNDQLKLRMWPVTASLWFKPVPAIYAGAGVGWYQVTYDWSSSLAPAIQDETKQQLGVHVGGGLRMPLAPAATLDLGGRYVMMREQDARLVPEKFDPDFWTTSIGLAVRF